MKLGNVLKIWLATACNVKMIPYRRYISTDLVVTLSSSKPLLWDCARRNEDFCTQLKAGRVSELRNKFWQYRTSAVLTCAPLGWTLWGHRTPLVTHFPFGKGIILIMVCRLPQRRELYHILVSWFSDPGLDHFLFGATHWTFFFLMDGVCNNFKVNMFWKHYSTV